jgi:hypothetical protein
MQDSGLLVQTLILIIAIPCLVVFYWVIGFQILAFIIRIVKVIWNSTN